MVCEHLRALEIELISRGLAETFRGQAWTHDCRDWVYFDCFLDVESIRKRLGLAACVTIHVNEDPRSGQECGLVCVEHGDAIIGSYSPAPGKPTII